MCKNFFKIYFKFYKWIFMETMNLKKIKNLTWIFWNEVRGLRLHWYVTVILLELKSEFSSYGKKKKNSKYHRTLKPTIFLFGEKNVLSWTRLSDFFTHIEIKMFLILLVRMFIASFMINCINSEPFFIRLVQNIFPSTDLIYPKSHYIRQQFIWFLITTR